MSTEYQPIRNQADLAQFLLNSTSEHDLATTQLAECYYFYLQEIAAGKAVSIAELAAIQEKYPQALLNGQPLNPETLASVLEYVGDRIPTKAFRDGVQFRLHSKTEKTMAVPHVYEKPDKKYRKKAPARSRWTLIDTTDAQHPIINFQLRDSVPTEPTDGLELCTWLGSLEQVRQAALQFVLQGKEKEYGLLIKSLAKVLKSHVGAELEMLNKRLAVEVMQGNKGQVIDQEFIISATKRVTVLEERLEKNDALARELFFEWIRRDGTKVLIQTEHPGDLQIDVDRSKQLTSVANMTAKLVAEGLEQAGIEPITDVFYGNDFTLRIFLSLGLFNQAEWQLMEVYFAKKYSVVKSTIEQISDPDIQEASRKFFFVQQLSLYKGNFNLINNLKQRLFSPETFDQIGITRIVQTKDSPTADPIDVIVPAKMNQAVFDNLPSAVKAIVQKIIDNKQVILSTAYPLGHLTAMLSEALRQKFSTIESFAFGGKVGLYSEGHTFDKVGELMFPSEVTNQFGDETLPVVNDLADTDFGMPDYKIRTGRNFTTLALTGQSHSEMTEQAQTLPESQALSLDVELYPFMEWVNKLPTSVQATLSILLGYYFSDKSIPPDKFNPVLHGGDKISERLGLRGSVPVFLSFYALLDQMAEKSAKKRDR